MLSTETASQYTRIPLLLGLLWAHRVTYSSPTAYVPLQPKSKESVVRGCVRGIRPPWVRQLSKWVIRTIVFVEIVAICISPLSERSSNAHIISMLELFMPAIHGADRIRVTPAFALGWMLMMGGGLLRVLCYRTLGNQFTFEITIRKGHRLVTEGPYSVVRHPSYTALVLVVLGSFMCFFTGGSWMRECHILDTLMGKLFVVAWAGELLHPPAVMVWARVEAEDELLRNEFGSEWEAWAKKTPCVLIPGIY
ncbi:hypothetical protein C8Q78DRAFT_315122 [Trametes maxima]|nr:hypothetical protein C8Q78DRAFT_315122 [Trametes maxima]